MLAELAAAGHVVEQLDRRGGQRGDGQHVDEVGGGLAEGEDDRALVLRDDAGQWVLLDVLLDGCGVLTDLREPVAELLEPHDQVLVVGQAAERHRGVAGAFDAEPLAAVTWRGGEVSHWALAGR